MVETSDEIRRELEITRERMGDTLAELERKLNPKNVIQNYPLATLGVAFGTGMVLGTRGRGNNKHRSHERTPLRSGRMPMDHSPSSVFDEIIGGVRSALITAGTIKLSHFLEGLLHKASKSIPKASTAANISENMPSSLVQRTPPPSGRRW